MPKCQDASKSTHDCNFEAILYFGFLVGSFLSGNAQSSLQMALADIDFPGMIAKSHSPTQNTTTRCHTAMASEVMVVVFHCKWAQAGPVLFCQRGGRAPYCGPRGTIIQYQYAKTLLKTPNAEKYSYSEF